MGPRLSLGSVATAEFKDAFDRLVSKGVLADQFIDIAHRGDHFVEDLKKGVELGVLSEAQAKEALSGKAQESYMQGLKTGAQEAETVVTAVLNTAIKEGVASRAEAVVINERIQPDVEDLAVATAKDLARDDIPEVQIKTRLIQASNILQKAKRLKGADVSTFLTSAEAALTKAKREVEAERTRLKEEADRMEAARVALAQKESDQQNLLDQFVGMLDLIATKQRALVAQFASYDEMEVERQTLSEQLNALRDEAVTIRGSSVTVFSAAAEYAEALSTIMGSRMTPVERKKQMDALEEQGFTKQTIAKIEQLRVLEPRLRDLIDRQAALAVDAERNHDGVVTLRAVYHVFRKLHIKSLIKPNRQAVVAKEAVVQRAQKNLNDRHLGLIGKSGIRARLSLDQPSVPVNVDPAANEEEVRALVALFRKPVVADASKPKKEEELAPAPSTLQWIYNGVTAPLRWAGMKV
jgi:hypothetical protein